MFDLRQAGIGGELVRRELVAESVKDVQHSFVLLQQIASRWTFGRIEGDEGPGE